MGGTSPLFISKSKVQNVPYNIIGVVYVQKTAVKTYRFYIRKLRKVIKIGVLGTINGIRIRSWFSHPSNHSTLQEVCQKYQIPFFQVPTVNSLETIQCINSMSPDLGISLGNSFIAKKIFTLFPNGMINIHGEILPEYQNAQSIIWQIYNGSTKTGFTIHKINERIDQGDILFQEEYPIHFKSSLKETVSFNSELTSNKATIGLIELLSNYEQYFNKSKSQGKGSSYTTPSIWSFIRIYFNYKRLFKSNKR